MTGTEFTMTQELFEEGARKTGQEIGYYIYDTTFNAYIAKLVDGTIVAFEGYVCTGSQGKNFYLHMKDDGNVILYFEGKINGPITTGVERIDEEDQGQGPWRCSVL